MKFFKPLPTTSAGKTFELRSKVLGVYDKGKAGTVVETETVLAEKGGDIYTKALGSAFFVGQGNWGGPKGKDKGENGRFESEVDEATRPKYGELPTTRREETGRCAYSADDERICPPVQVRCLLPACYPGGRLTSQA